MYPNCFWRDGKCQDERFAGCPPMDVGFLLDGSGSMSIAFTSYPKGYIGMFEIIRDWIQDIPLTNTNAAYGAKVGNASGFRVGIVQFSSPTVASVDPFTKGLLTGDRAELNAAVDWQERNPQYGGTYVKAGIQKILTCSTSLLHQESMCVFY